MAYLGSGLGKSKNGPLLFYGSMLDWSPAGNAAKANAIEALVIFDIDGTLAKASTLHQEAFKHGLETLFGVRFPEWGQYAGRTDKWIAKRLGERAGIDPRDVEGRMEELCDTMVNWYVANASKEHGTVFPGITELLEAVDGRGFLRSLVTGNLEAIAFHKLSRLGLAGGFARGAFGSDHEDRSRLLGIAVERAAANFPFTPRPGIKKGNIFYVADTPRDVEAAHVAGIPAIVPVTRYNASEDFSERVPDLLVDGLREHVDLVIEFIEKRSKEDGRKARN